MIKEKKRISKYNFVKTKKQIAVEYLRTIAISILVAIIITTSIAIHARNEMIKNLYNPKKENNITKAIAEQILSYPDITERLEDKSGKTCLKIGDLYYATGNYTQAIYAYNLACLKMKTGYYLPYYKLVCAYATIGDFKKALTIIKRIQDVNTVQLLKFKTKSYIAVGDKYYSIGKFLSAAKNYENANFYYSKFSRKDKEAERSIKERIVNSYIQVADLMVRSGMNSDATRFLKKAESYAPKDLNVKYRLGIILADSNPEESIKYIEPLLEKIPQNIDYGVYNSALMKAATIADLDNRPTQAKYYRYKIHSLDLLTARKVVYKNDIDVIMESAKVNKVLFTYPIKAKFKIYNKSNHILNNLYGDFCLCNDKKTFETISHKIASKENPIIPETFNTTDITVKFRKKVFTQKELNTYFIDVYLYKDKKYKTLVSRIKIPQKSY